MSVSTQFIGKGAELRVFVIGTSEQLNRVKTGGWWQVMVKLRKLTKTVTL